MSFGRNAVRAGLGTLVVAASLLTAEGTPAPDASRTAATAASPVVLHAHVPVGQVTGVPVVRSATFAYAATKDPRQRLIATWRPARTSAPWVATIHGGSWVKGNPDDVAPAAQLFSRHGFAVFNLAYRLVRAGSPVRWADQRADVLTALAWIRDHAATFGIDPDRGALYGSSAGGNLALASGLAGDGGNGIRGIVSASGVVQPARLWDDVLHRNRGERATPGIRKLAGFAGRAAGCAYPARTPPCRAIWRAMDVASAVSPHDPAVLLYQGRADHTVPYQMAQQFRTQLDRADIGGSLVLVPRLGHVQRVALDDGPRQARLLAFLRARTAVTTAPALTRLAVTPRVGVAGRPRLTVHVRPQRAGMVASGQVVAVVGRTTVRVALRRSRAVVTLPRRTTRTAVRVRYEGSPLLQPSGARLVLLAR